MGLRPRLSAAAASPLKGYGNPRAAARRTIHRIVVNPSLWRNSSVCRIFSWAPIPVFQFSPAYARRYLLPPPTRLGVGASFSMGLRPRLSAAAASPLKGYGNPRAAARRTIHRIVVNPSLWRNSSVCRIFSWAPIPVFQFSPAYARRYLLSPPTRLGVGASFSMGLRPRLSAAAASPLKGYGNPRAAARRTIHRIVVNPSLWRNSSVCRIFSWAPIPVFQFSPAYARRYLLPPPTRLGVGGIVFHGLTPTAKCWRRYAAQSGEWLCMAFSHVRHTNPGYASPANP